MIELETLSIDEPRGCSSCGCMTFTQLILGGMIDIPLCDFCKQLAIDVLQDYLNGKK